MPSIRCVLPCFMKCKQERRGLLIFDEEKRYLVQSGSDNECFCQSIQPENRMAAAPVCLFRSPSRTLPCGKCSGSEQVNGRRTDLCNEACPQLTECSEPCSCHTHSGAGNVGVNCKEKDVNFACMLSPVTVLPDIIQHTAVRDSTSLSSVSTGSTTAKSDYFVFILAGDNNKQNQALQVQLESLSDALKQDCIPHVIMSSCWKLPIIKLRRHILNQLPKLTSEDPNGADCFLKESLKKASRVLLLISPGTYSYLDKYAKGGKEHSNQLQAKLRLCYETLKDEWFKQDSKYHRILPVMLTNMETDQSHCPSFLIESKLYWFPHRPLDSDYTVIKVLQNLLKKDTRLKKQLNVISQKK